MPQKMRCCMERSSAYDDPATAHRNRDRPHRLHHTGGKKLYLSKPNASGMLRMLEQELYAVRGQGHIYRLRLGVQSYSPAVEAAIRLTQEYQGRRSSNASTFLAAASARFPIWG